MWDTETKPLPNRQIVRDVAGQWIGRVPLALAKIVSKGIVEDKITHAHAAYTGEILHDGPLIGGGPKLSCVYFFEIRNTVTANKISAKFLNIADAFKHEDLD